MKKKKAFLPDRKLILSGLYIGLKRKLVSFGKINY